MKKIYLLMILFNCGVLFSQSTEIATEKNNRWTYGGGVGLGFGSGGYFDLQLSPRVGFKLTNDLETGLAGNFSWQSSQYYKSTMIGFGPFMNYYFGRSFYLGANLQQYFINTTDKYTRTNYKKNETALYLGGGYLQPIGTNSFMQFGLMYNVLWKEKSSTFSTGFVPSFGFVMGL